MQGGEAAPIGQSPPLWGEMAGRPEGGAVPPAFQEWQLNFCSFPCFEKGSQDWRSFAPPSALPGISPTRGEISSSCASLSLPMHYGKTDGSVGHAAL